MYPKLLIPGGTGCYEAIHVARKQGCYVSQYNGLRVYTPSNGGHLPDICRIGRNVLDFLQNLIDTLLRDFQGEVPR